MSGATEVLEEILPHHQNIGHHFERLHVWRSCLREHITPSSPFPFIETRFREGRWPSEGGSAKLGILS